MLKVRAATEADARSLAPRLRAQDIYECRVVGGIEPLTALFVGLFRGEASAIVDEDDLPVAMFGAAPDAPGVATVWLLVSDELSRLSYAKQILGGFTEWVERLQGDYDMIRNVIPKSNTPTIRLLQRAGFVFLPHDDECVELVRIRHV